jgi:hypothetical protein
MKVARLASVAACLAVLVACSDVQVVPETTEASETTVEPAPDAQPEDEAETGTTAVAPTTVPPTTVAPTTTTTVAPTTTTTVAPTTTVLDTLCIKTTACQYANLVGIDFSRLKLDFIDFSVARLAGASFVGANLTNSVFIRADLSAVNFEGATLKNVDFTAATLIAASLKGANLEGAVLCDVDLVGVLDLTKEQLEKVKKFRTKGKVYCP